MGLFGSTKTVISVASTVYNMSGDYNSNDKYLKALMLGGILRNVSPTDTLLTSFFVCPKAKFNKFFNYAISNNYKGNLTTKINNRKKIDVDIVTSYLNPGSGSFVKVDKAFIDYGDITYWANKHILLNYPSLVFTEWLAELAPLNKIKIIYEDASEELIDLPNDFLYTNEYLIASIEYYNESYDEPEEEGAIINVVFEDLPNTSDYISLDYITTDNSVSLTETTTVLTEYSDSTLPTTTTSSTSSTEVFTSYIKTKEKTTYLGLISSGIIKSLKETYIEYLDYNVIETTEVSTEVIDHGTYTETITTTVVTELFEPVYSYQINSQLTVLSELINEDMFIYKMGSGVAELDALNSTSTAISEDLYPIIPLRISNTSVKDIPEWYNEAKTAYSLVVGQSFDKLLDTIEDNPSIGDIDYAYIHFGFALNTQSNDEKLYIYEFFKDLINYQNTTRTDYINWLNALYEQRQFINDYRAWIEAQSDPTDPLFYTTRPLLNGTIATKLTLPSETILDLKTNNLDYNNPLSDNFDIKIAWRNIQEDIYSGLGKTVAVKGDIWFSTVPPSEKSEFDNAEFNSIEDFTYMLILGLNINSPFMGSLKDTHIYLYHQIESTSYRVLSIAGLEHRNYIYRGYYNVGITGKQAIEDIELSGFIIPLSQNILNKLSWNVGNEICIRAGNLLFNSWVSKKQKWYQSSVFRFIVIVVLIIITVVVTVLTAGTATGPVSSIATAIVTALAVTGTTALILTAILTVAINMLIGMVISAILTKLLTPLIGKKYAKIVSTIATVFITAGINSSFDLSAMESLLLRADNLIMLGLSITNSVIEGMYDIQGLSQEIKYLEEKNKEQDKRIKENNELLGLTKADDLINRVLEQIILEETPEEFLSRTLMRSDDIIQLSMDAINRFTDIVL